jgi:hypothetical protein
MITDQNSSFREHGFSLAEVLLVLCGFAILAGIGVPVLDTIMSRFGTITAAQQIASQLQNTRMKAVSLNEPFRVRFVASSNSYQLETAAGQLHAGPYALPAGTTFNAGAGAPITFPESYVLFLPNGNLPASGGGSAGRVKLINRDGLRIDIVVSPGGMVRMTPTYHSQTPPF